MVCIGFNFSFFTPLWGLEPPRPGEIERLRAAGKLDENLKMAKELGNYKADPLLVYKMKIKIEKIKNKIRGISDATVNETSPAPPPDWQGGLPSTGSPRVFALLIEFQDYTHTIDAAGISDMFWADGNPADYPLESLTEYYDRTSHSLLDLSGGATLGWYKTSYNRSSVTQTTEGRENLIKEALDSFNPSHDFTVYDNDGDGDIEYFIVIWTGPPGSWASFWWGYYTSWWYFPSYTIDGKTLGTYSWQWEPDDPSVVIHETGHALGLPDYYDYDDKKGPDGGVGGFDMMDWRGDHNCFSKWMLDWITPTVVSSGAQTISLDDILNSTDCVLIWSGVGLDDLFSEFFMVENRQFLGNDESLWFTPDGLAIWHVDSTLDTSGTDFKYDNSYTRHKLLRLMEADGLEEIETGDGNADGNDFYNTGDEFDSTSFPSSEAYDGTDSCVSVTEINDLGASPGDEMRADFRASCLTEGSLQFGSATYSESEAGGSATITVTRTGGSDGAVGINYATSNGTAAAGSDYTSNSGNLSWPDGDSTSKTFQVDIINDSIYEGNETINLTLSSPTGGASLGSQNTAVLTIIEDDVAPTRIIRLDGNMAFGDVQVGSTAQRTLTIYNDGNSALTVSDITCPTGFSGSWSGSISPSGSHAVTVTFAPASAISYGGTITVNSDKTSGTNTIPCSGTGISSCAYDIFPTSESFESIGGSDSLAVTGQSGCAWTASSNDAWINITAGTSGSGNGTVYYTVSINSTSGPRNGTMTIAGNSFTVYQAGYNQLCGEVFDGFGGPLMPADNPHLITCDIVVPTGETLTIYPGVEILFMGNRSITANGSLSADGESGSIIFSDFDSYLTGTDPARMVINNLLIIGDGGTLSSVP